MSQSPKASIITAAYNRSNVLRFAIESVRRQSFYDWEHIIVGDHCTDDTEAVVAAFGDDRIRFVNLPQNTGGQSGPHNYALSVARGQYLYYLNQDDFYFPDHVESSIAYLESTGADIIWSPVALPAVNNRNLQDWRVQPIILDGVTTNGNFDPNVFIISSSWAMRSSVTSRVGHWKSASETAVSPSQEYIFRAWKVGCEIKYHPHVSVLCIHSGVRHNSYAARDFAEHELYFKLVFEKTDGFAKIFERIALTMAEASLAANTQVLSRALRNMPNALLCKALSAIGIHPGAFNFYSRYKSDGGFIAWHRKRVLGAPHLRKGDVIRIGDSAANDFLGFGWSIPEATHRWTESTYGQVTFRLSEEPRPEKLVIFGRPMVAQIVEFQIQGQSPVRHDYSDGHEIVEVPLTSDADPLSLTIVVSQTVRPKDLNGSPDTRSLGFCVQKIELT